MMNRWMLQSASLFAGLGLAMPGMAQEFSPLFEPRVPEAAERDVRVADPQPEVTASREVVLDKLHGLALVGPKVKPSEVRVARGVVDIRVEVPDVDGLRARLQPYVGQAMSLADLQAMSNEVVLHYREQDFPVVDVMVPEQDITEGVVVLQVVEGLLGEKRARGTRYFSADRMLGEVRVEKGDRLNQQSLQDDLDWINRNPFREVGLLFTPGAAFGETDIILDVEERRPVRFYTAFEDTGNELTGDERLIFGLNTGNAFGAEHLFSYQYMTDTDFDRLQAHSAVYSIPLPWRHVWTLYGSHVDAKVNQGVTNNRGNNYQLSTRYEIPLASTGRKGAFRHGLEFGFDYKHSNNDLEFAGIRVLDVETDIFQLTSSYRGSLRDETGVTIFSLDAFFSPGGLNAKNRNSAFNQARFDADAQYIYGAVRLERQQRLPEDFSLICRIHGQAASTNLLPSEQLGVGGYSSVRGFEEFEARGDHGLIANVELRTPSFSPASRWLGAAAKDELQLLGFYDHGWVASKSRLPGEPSSRSLSSAGLGFRYAWGQNLSARFDYGWQINGSGIPGAEQSGRMHFSISAAF